jgi:hypothetical protein
MHPAVIRLMEIIAHICADLPIITVKKALHTLTPAAPPTPTPPSVEALLFLHLTGKETEAQGCALLNATPPAMDIPRVFKSEGEQLSLMKHLLHLQLTSLEPSLSSKESQIPFFCLLSQGGRYSREIATHLLGGGELGFESGAKTVAHSCL